MKLKTLLLTVCTLAVLLSCDHSENVVPRYGTLSIRFENPVDPGGRIKESQSPAFVVLSITTATGETIVNSKKLELLSFGTGYTTESLQLPVGSYQLVQFQILNSDNSVIYATPVTGSLKSNLVQHPLPIAFDIAENGSTHLVPEVLAVDEETTPDAFGYASFGFTVVTPGGNTVTDIDGNVYHTVKIGTQTWMVENLKVTKFNDGTSIPLVAENTIWNSLITPGYCWYNNDASMKNTAYGAIYNWYAVNTGKLAPQGWHVPTDAEWATLISYAGGEATAGAILKEAGTAHWSSHVGAPATNGFGFSLLPAGNRGNNGVFGNMTLGAYMWHSDNIVSWGGAVTYFQLHPNSYYWSPVNKEMGHSVRCIKD